MPDHAATARQYIELAARTTDPDLAEAYRNLAQGYELLARGTELLKRHNAAQDDTPPTEIRSGDTIAHMEQPRAPG